MRIFVSALLSLFVLQNVWAEQNPAIASAPSVMQQSTNVTTKDAISKKAALVEPASTTGQALQKKAEEEAKVKALIKDQATRMQELEKANLDALAQNQELQLKNDNLTVQVQVLKSERSAQMFMYGAITVVGGVILGCIIASYIQAKRRRQW